MVKIMKEVGECMNDDKRVWSVWKEDRSGWFNEEMKVMSDNIMREGVIQLSLFLYVHHYDALILPHVINPIALEIK